MKSFSIRLILLPLLLFSAAGCGALSGHSPTIDVLGSYFPAWMVCILIGLALTTIARLTFIAIGLNAYLRPAPLVYPCLMLIFTMAVWLAFYRN